MSDHLTQGTHDRPSSALADGADSNQWLIVALAVGVAIVAGSVAAESLAGWLMCLAIGVVVAFLPRPSMVLLLLCCGFLIANRSFAFLHMRVGSLPVFVTEGSMLLFSLLLALKVLVAGRLSILVHRRLRAPLVLFYGFGALALATSLVRCLFGEAELLITLRNAAIFYYSFFYLVVIAGFRATDQFYRLMPLFHGLTFLMSVQSLLVHFGVLQPLFPSNLSLIAVPLSVLVLFSMLPVIRWKVPAIIAMAIGLVALELTEVRQVYLGVLAGGCVVFWMLMRGRMLRRSHVSLVMCLVMCLLLPVILWFGAESGMSFGGRLAGRGLNDTGRLFLWEEFSDDWRGSAERVLLGAGFGRNFIPKGMLTLHARHSIENQATGQIQIDPHNSLLHLLYRIGVFGSVGCLLMMRFAFLQCTRLLATRGADLGSKLATAGLLAGLASVGAQALVGVILEAPHRGIWFWLWLGLCSAFPAAALREAKRSIESNK